MLTCSLMLDETFICRVFYRRWLSSLLPNVTVLLLPNAWKLATLIKSSRHQKFQIKYKQCVLQLLTSLPLYIITLSSFSYPSKLSYICISTSKSASVKLQIQRHKHKTTHPSSLYSVFFVPILSLRHRSLIAVPSPPLLRHGQAGLLLRAHHGAARLLQQALARHRQRRHHQRPPPGIKAAFSDILYLY